MALAALEADHGLALAAPVIRHQHLRRKEIMAVQETLVTLVAAAVEHLLLVRLGLRQ